MDMYPDTMVRITLFLDILPKQIRSPSGRENSKVTKKISIETSIPPASCWSITLKLIFFLLVRSISPIYRTDTCNSCKQQEMSVYGSSFCAEAPSFPFYAEASKASAMFLISTAVG